jgi:hypothetical protein
MFPEFRKHGNVPVVSHSRSIVEATFQSGIVRLESFGPHGDVRAGIGCTSHQCRSARPWPGAKRRARCSLAARSARFYRPLEQTRLDSIRCSLQTVERLQTRPGCRAASTDVTVCSYPLPRSLSITFPECRKRGNVQTLLTSKGAHCVFRGEGVGASM